MGTVTDRLRRWQHYDVEQHRIDTPQEYDRIARVCADAGQYLD